MSTPLPPDLDLAFELGAVLGPALTKAAGPWADPLAGADLWHQKISAWLGQLAAELPTALQASAYCLGLTLVDDPAIAELNQDWRQKSGPTDVLAFAAQDSCQDDCGHALGAMPRPEPGGPGAEELELGDIVISLETAARQAAEQGHSLEREMLFLASHGLLHLLGWDHPDDGSLAAMLERQEKLIAGDS
ncbi:rRNA maturation RNase YbeY [Cyanobium sp. WAJ14-Wanaka]|uniref:rRNA maturation RNase YbeY n=1 Tax=Cyanobium sp. WAJ14-Wanaka TaxID=2823725 RepID=UPI0020CBE0EC|nr:rRNA maturation RNase YbeY [Cyanobium sp. WAJ14-Wanaka]MCP9775382.1 rRNA maturation RNase YbeY [Cyanobium sp. WAJ14-Wanaka]